MSPRRIWVGVSSVGSDETTSRYLDPQAQGATGHLPPMIRTRFGAPDPAPGDYMVIGRDDIPDRAFDTEPLRSRLPGGTALPGLDKALAGDTGREIRSIFHVIADGDPTRGTDGTVTITDVLDVADVSETSTTKPPTQTHFSFKPAPLRFAQTWELRGDTLTTPATTLDLRRVTGCQMAEMGLKGGGVIRRLDLTHPGGKLSVPVTGAWNDRQVQTHAALMVAILERLAARDPDLPLVIGEGGAPRVMMFVVGLVSLLFSAGMGVAVLAWSGRGGQDVIAPLGVLIVFGLVVAWRYRPWRKRPVLGVAAGAILVQALKR
ncbi:hypothetical protein [Pseudooceanicola onchidii]|uniref:hypothetical protein n=1 Tax=Pseudooceanicola onchidii TaxID=2562279 RepID=UPI0010AA0728|nr:hypothetical protein [Pseudooceanicola onchidii]